MLSGAGMAPLPPGFHKLHSVTVTTFAVFLSWMYFLGGDDNCMLSVPSCTCDLHICCWQSGEICQVIAAAAFTMFNYALWSSSKEDGLFLFSWPDTAFPLLSFNATGLLGHAGGWHLRRKPCVFPLLFLLDFSAPVGFFKVFQAATVKFLFSVVEMSRPWIFVELFLGSPTFRLPTLYSTFYSGYAWMSSKITTSCCVVFGSIVCRL